MSFFSRFSKRIEEVNNGEASLETLSKKLELDELVILQEDAMAQWKEMAQMLIVNSVKATNCSVERAFIFIDFKSTSPSFDIFYQEKGRLIFWNELTDTESQYKIKNQLLPQAKEVVNHLNQIFDKANLERIAYAELQFEEATGAWFSHIIWSSNEESKITKEKILTKWFNGIQSVVPTMDLASDSKLPWYPV